MDWNNDGSVDFQDHALFDMETSGGGGNGGGSSGGGSGNGCLSFILIIVIALQIIKWLTEIID